MSASWTVTASRTSARIFARGDDGLVLVHSLVHDEGRLRDTEVGTDRPGRAFDRAGEGRHALGQSTQPHEHSAQVFARQIAEFLRKGRLESRFKRLVLVAEPHFLGLVREALDEPTARLVTASIAKDLERVPAVELEQHLPSA